MGITTAFRMGKAFIIAFIIQLVGWGLLDYDITGIAAALFTFSGMVFMFLLEEQP